jgi:hypothetical protein
VTEGENREPPYVDFSARNRPDSPEDLDVARQRLEADVADPVSIPVALWRVETPQTVGAEPRRVEAALVNTKERRCGVD